MYLVWRVVGSCCLVLLGVVRCCGVCYCPWLVSVLFECVVDGCNLRSLRCVVLAVDACCRVCGLLCVVVVMLCVVCVFVCVWSYRVLAFVVCCLMNINV